MIRLEKVLRGAYRVTDAKVSLDGNSLGGIYTRELSEKFPGLVERAILLGSPLKDPVGSTSVNLKLLAEFFYRRCQFRGGPANGQVSLSRDPPEVPETLIYSKTDALVQWQSCIELVRRVEAMEVRSSHGGLPYSSEAFEIIAARLEQCTEQRPTNKGP